MQRFFSQTFAALKHRNYRLWFTGQLVSLFGTWMQTTAQGYLVFQLTGSPAYLGYVGFAAGVPSWLFMLYGGLTADRMSRRKMLLLTQTTMMLLAFILAALVFTGQVQPWHIIFLAFLLGTANAFDAPARQAFVRELVDREDMTNAIALNSSMFNLAAVVGPAVAGITYALLGPAWCFIINGLTFIAVIIALLLMHIQVEPIHERIQSAYQEILTGFRYVAAEPVIRILILNLAVVSLFGLGFIALMPAWSVDVLGGDASTNGYLFSARCIGALSGALMIASAGKSSKKGRLMTVGSFIMPFFLMLFSMTRWLPASMLALMGVGWGFMVMLNTSNALVQTHIPDELRGRVMAIYTLTFFGLMPVGSLLNGALAARIGAPATVLINGIVLILFAAGVWLRAPSLRTLQ